MSRKKKRQSGKQVGLEGKTETELLDQRPVLPPNQLYADISFIAQLEYRYMHGDDDALEQLKKIYKAIEKHGPL